MLHAELVEQETDAVTSAETCLFTAAEVTQKKECTIRAERSADSDKNHGAKAINTIEKGNKTQKEMGNGQISHSH